MSITGKLFLSQFCEGHTLVGGICGMEEQIHAPQHGQCSRKQMECMEKQWSLQVQRRSCWRAALSSPITVGVVPVVLLKCLLNRSCKHQCGADVATGITSCYAFGQIFNFCCDLHLTYFSNKMYHGDCQVDFRFGSKDVSFYYAQSWRSHSKNRLLTQNPFQSKIGHTLS